MSTSHDVLLKPNRRTSLSIVRDGFTFKAVSEDTNGQSTLVELRVDPEIEPLPHIHHREDEAFYIQAGELEFQLGDQTVIATPFGSSTQVRHRIHYVNSSIALKEKS